MEGTSDAQRQQVGNYNIVLHPVLGAHIKEDMMLQINQYSIKDDNPRTVTVPEDWYMDLLETEAMIRAIKRILEAGVYLSGDDLKKIYGVKIGEEKCTSE